MTKWDYDVRTLADADRLPVLKKMGSEGWEMIGLKEEPRSGTPGLNDAATYITYWFKRPMVDVVQLGGPMVLAPHSNAWGDERPKEIDYEADDREYIRQHETRRTSKPNFVLAPATFNLTVLIDDQNKMLRIMSEAGWYIKDVSKDRKVDGAFVTYMFTKRQKKETGVAYELEE